MNFRDVELLSSYLDGQLSPSDSARLEKRLASDAGLKSALEDLRSTRALLRKLPQRTAPRSFRLTPKMAGVRPPAPRAYPIFRLATAVATFLFLASVAVNAFAPVASQHLAAVPAPVYGIGGGGGYGGGGGPAEGGATQQPPAAAAPAATEAPLQQPFAAVAQTPTPAGTQAADAAATQVQETQVASQNLSGTGPSTQASKAAPVTPPVRQAFHRQPVPLPWEIALGALMIVSGAAAWLLRQSNDRRIRKQWDRK